MTESQKLLGGASLSLLVGLCTAAAGYLYRDSFDSPRLRIQLVQFELTRHQCTISPASVYRFRTSHALRQHIEAALPWSLANDLKDDEIEYEHAEDLLRLLPQRRTFLERELPFVKAELDGLALYQTAPSPEREALVKGTIAYAAGVTAKPEEASGDLQVLYARFDDDPAGFVRTLVANLNGWRRSIEQEVELIPILVGELDACRAGGRPAALPMISSNLHEMPNVTFSVSLLNLGRSDGQVSHSIVFRSSAGYEINLVGQNPLYNTVTSPMAWARIRSNEMDRLGYTIDRIRNQPERVEKFYEDLIGEDGISGTFVVHDVEGDAYTFRVEGLEATN